MIPKECKRLAEVDFPIAVVSRHAAKEKSIRHGHPSTLHLWWARRPLASSRAVLLACLLPDPCDPECPQEFKEQARALVGKVRSKIGARDMDLRKALLLFIGDFANWDLAASPVYLEVARGLVKASYPDEPPLVVDPFAGGGSIPLEALRVGAEAFASDLNPVACLILKVLLEDIPRHGTALAEELRKAGAEIKKAAETELADLYPKDPDGSTPIAYIWARTVRCESPKCGAEIPLVRSFWLCKKAERRRALRYSVERHADQPAKVVFEIFEPASEREVPPGTVTRARASCTACGSVLQPERVRAQLIAQRGGADVVFDTKERRIGGAQLLAVVILQPGQSGRQYRLPTTLDYAAVLESQKRLLKLSKESLPGGLSLVPDEPTPVGGGSGAGRAFSIQKYGMMSFGDLFTARQKVGLATLVRVVGLTPTGQDSKQVLAACISRLADIQNSLCSWKPSMSQVIHVFTRQALPMVWDFAEASMWGGQAGDLATTIDNVARIPKEFAFQISPGQVQLEDAGRMSLPEESAACWFTDPPYYDAIPYSDLSDFFFVWLKRALPGHPLMRDPFDPTNALTPKSREAVQNEKSLDENGAPKDKAFYEAAMARAFAEGRRVLREDGVGCVVFAHKTTEGWEALLSGLIRGGWTITASWPLATEMGTRLRAHDSAALATSVHLVMRSRPEGAPVGDWGEVLRELPDRIGDWMERLEEEKVRGADLVFACIGPALEVFSRYSKVETAEGREVPLDEFLAKVWEVAGRTALGQVLGTAEAKARNGAAGAIEEDARLTALFLWTLQSTDQNGNGHEKDGEEAEEEDDDEEAPSKARKGYGLSFDMVKRFAQPLGIRLDLWEGRVIETEKGIVRLLAVSERSAQLFGEEDRQNLALDADPFQDRRSQQPSLFVEAKDEAPAVKGRSRKHGAGQLAKAGAPTTLDRVHAAMLLQSWGRSGALRALLVEERERGTDFFRLANALSALYPKQSEEKRLLDAMLLAAPR